MKTQLTNQDIYKRLSEKKGKKTSIQTILNKTRTGNMVKNGWQITCNIMIDDLWLRDPSMFSQKKSNV